MLHDVLQSFFSECPKRSGKGYEYIIVEGQNEYEILSSNDPISDIEQSVISIHYNDEQEISVIWYQNKRPIVSIERVAVQSVISLREDEEEALQFVFERWPSRMLQIQCKPYFAVEMGIYWEVCEECEEE